MKDVRRPARGRRGPRRRWLHAAARPPAPRVQPEPAQAPGPSPAEDAQPAGASTVEIPSTRQIDSFRYRC
eukprot:1101127-Prorocentrum_minimum.AAC.4